MKKGKMLRLIGSVCVIIITASLLLAACAPQAATPGAPTTITPQVPTQQPQAPTTVKPSIPQATPAPQPAAEVIKWRAVDHLTRGTVRSVINQDYLKMIEAMSGGRIQTTYYAAAELMPTEQLVDALINGLVEWYHGYGPYFQGKLGNIVVIESGMANLMSNEGQWNLLTSGGMLDILKEAYATQNIYYSLAVGLYPIGGDYLYSRNPIPNAAALTGMKVRSAGISAEILSAMGASTAYFPWEELYLALQTGTVDACEMATMSEMFDLGLAEVAPHWYVPAWISSGICNYLVNMKAWQALSPDLQAIVDAAGAAVNTRHGAEPWRADYVGIPKFEAAGVTMHTWSDQDLRLFLKGWKNVMENLGASGDKWCAEAFDKIKAERTLLRAWPED